MKAVVVAALICAAGGAMAQVTVSSESYPMKGVGGALPIAGPAKQAAPAPAAYQIVKDEPIHSQIEAWAKGAGWSLIWQPSVSWKAVGDASFAQFSDVTLAVAEVVGILRDEGKPIRLKIAEGNRIMEVVSNEIRGVE